VEPIRRAVRAWDGFWFDARGPSTLLVLRTGLALVTLAWALSLAPDLEAFFSESGILPYPELESRRIGLLHVFDATAAVFALYATLLVAALGLLAGFRVRVCAPLVWVCVLSLQLRNPLLWNAGDTLLRLLLGYLALQAVVTGDLGPRSWGSGARQPGPAPYWGVRLIQLQTSAVYLFAALDKLRGETWWAGTAVPRALSLVEYQRFPLPSWLAGSSAAGALLSWGTVALELLLPLLLWWRPTRLLAIGVAIVLHLGFDYALRIGFFSGVMILGCLSFLPPRPVHHAT